MLALTPHIQVILCLSAIDFRLGIDRLASLIEATLKLPPDNGWIYIFCNKKRTCLKLLCFDGSGYWLMQKRAAKAKFPWPESRPSSLNGSMSLAVEELMSLINLKPPVSSAHDSTWKKISGQKLN